MRTLRCTLLATVCCAALVRCDVYKDHFTGDFNAGSADPFNYPPPYRGVGATRNIAGSGSGITEVRAFVGGNGIGYFLFPYGTSQVVTPGYTYTAAQISNQRTTALNASRTLPLAYVFDPPGTNTAFPATPQCNAASGYVYNRRTDDVRYDDQGNIFIGLPNANFPQGGLPTWTYVPIVQEVPVTSNGEPCQDIKSEKTLLTRSDVSVQKSDDGSKGVPDGKFLAWALFDPGSAVYRAGQTSATSQGVAIQRWGWYQQFLVAYLDGGYIPLASATQFRTQKLYIPSQVIPTGTPTPPVGPGRVGAGYDVLEFSPGDPGYSPICEVQVYTTTATTTQASLPKSAAAAAAMTPVNAPANPPAGSIVSGTTVPPFVFCLQIPRRAEE